MKNQFAYAQWPWGTKTREEFIQSCADMSSVGFKYFESVRAFIDTFINDFADFKAITDEYNVHPVSFYFHLKGNYENDVTGLKDRIGFVAKNGIKTISLQSTMFPSRPEPYTNLADNEHMRYALDTTIEVAKICREYGITPCVHPHYNSSIMYENEIDFIMQNTDPELVGFGPDTAHLIAGRCDPVAMFDRYKERIKFVHLKDITGDMDVRGIDQTIGVEVYSNFRELGEGIVDFPGVFRVLKSVGYGGYLCAELDKTRYTNKASAAISLKYLNENW